MSFDQMLDTGGEICYNQYVIKTASGRANGDEQKSTFAGALVELIVAVVLPELDQDTGKRAFCFYS